MAELVNLLRYQHVLTDSLTLCNPTQPLLALSELLTELHQSNFCIIQVITLRSTNKKCSVSVVCPPTPQPDPENAPTHQVRSTGGYRHQRLLEDRQWRDGGRGLSAVRVDRKLPADDI